MPTYAYDVECLKNLFTATFVNVEDPTDYRAYHIGPAHDPKTSIQQSELVQFLKLKMTLVGFNNHSYDDAMLRFIMAYRGTKINADLYDLSGKLINEDFRSDKKIIELRYPKKTVYPWKSIDLMRMMAFDRLGVSLKQVAINLKWHRIQDMPIIHSSSVHVLDIENILDYNLNDVLVTSKLYDTLAPIRKLRSELSELYSIDLSSASDSRMANLILEHFYANELRMDIRTIRDMRTRRDSVLLGDCIAKFVKFKTPQLNEMLDRISATYVYYYNNYKYSESIPFANCTFSLGVGGLHTEDDPGVFVTDDKYIIQDMDVASYYPNLIINNGFYPEHLGPDFINVLKKITQERMEAKHSGNKVKADGLKITINSIFGKFGSENFWLQDAKQLLSTTLSGQMGLLMLVEELHTNGIHVISCNTDGIVCKIPRELESKYYEIAKDWERKTSLELEFTQYKKYVRRDVNSYITEKEDGSTKEKGAFLKEVDLRKAYHMPIVAKALHAYFIKGVPVRKTLVDCRDIMEFCISQKTGPKFSMELHTGRKIEKLQKTNRFYVTRKGGSLIKRDPTTNRLTGLYVGNMVRILNTYDASVPFEDYEVDLLFYEKEVMKIVDEIEPKQMQLFDLSSLGQSSITKATVAPPKVEELKREEWLKSTELNKLGKNQFTKKMQSIVSANQKVEKISPRYVYIISFNSKSMTADVYCLAKGTIQTLAVDKGAYKKNGLETGQVIFCDKFEKLEYGYSISEYRVTTKLEEEKKRLI